MDIKRNSIFFGLSKLLVLLIFIPFFLVQCFFNYSNIVEGSSEISQLAYNPVVSNKHIETVNPGKKGTEKQSSFTLNKRFEPSINLSFIHVTFELPVCFFETKFFNKYTNTLLPSPQFHTGSLRGPPVVA